MARVVDDEECFGLLLFGSKPFFVVINQLTQIMMANILYSINVISFKAKSLESVIDIDHVLSDCLKVFPYALASHLSKFDISGISDYQSQLPIWGEVALLFMNAHHLVPFFIYYYCWELVRLNTFKN